MLVHFLRSMIAHMNSLDWAKTEYNGIFFENAPDSVDNNYIVFSLGGPNLTEHHTQLNLDSEHLFVYRTVVCTAYCLTVEKAAKAVSKLVSSFKGISSVGDCKIAGFTVIDTDVQELDERDEHSRRVQVGIAVVEFMVNETIRPGE